MIRIIYFTDRGERLAKRITGDNDLVDGRAGHTEEALKDAFNTKKDLVFVGAAGIAVRLIAPYIIDKTSDPAVIVMDETGRFVISLLSGHLGGANELTRRIASDIGASPVITTATDLEHKFAVDVFAKNNDLGILNPSAIKTVSAKVLNGKKPAMRASSSTVFYQEDCRDSVRPVRENEQADIEIIDGDSLIVILKSAGIDPYLPLPDRAVREKMLYTAGIGDNCLYLYKKDLDIGIGCRKGTSVDEIFPFLKDVMMNRRLCMAAVSSVSSIDIKKEEPGILGVCGLLRVPFFTYSAEELGTVKGDFVSSEFVKRTVGVDNVCERAAALTAGASGKKVVGRMKTGKVTVSIYRHI